MKCLDGFVLESNTCREGNGCNRTNGVFCVLFEEGVVQMNATDGIETTRTSCVEFVENECVLCEKGMMPMKKENVKKMKTTQFVLNGLKTHVFDVKMECFLKMDCVFVCFFFK